MDVSDSLKTEMRNFRYYAPRGLKALHAEHIAIAEYTPPACHITQDERQFVFKVLDLVIGKAVQGWTVYELSEVDTSSKDKSPGWPYRPAGFKTKEDFLNGDLASNVDEMWDAMLRGDKLNLMWTCFLKEECLTEEKVLENRPRLIIQCPADAHYCFSRLTANFHERLIANRHRTWIKLGTGPFDLSYQEMHDYVEENRCKGSVCCEEDGKRYDRRIAAECHDVVRDYRIHTADDPSSVEKPLGSMYAETRASLVILADGSVYLKLGGVNSGGPTTSDDGSLFRIVGEAVGFHREFPEVTAEEFVKNMVYLIAGDDMIVCGPKEWIERRRPRLEEVGIFTKSHLYSDTVVGLSFLGHKFGYHPHSQGRIVPIPCEPGKHLQAMRVTTVGNASTIQANGLLLARVIGGFWSDWFIDEVRRVYWRYIVDHQDITPRYDPDEFSEDRNLRDMLPAVVPSYFMPLERYLGYESGPGRV
jgi:hypothetical protein